MDSNPFIILLLGMCIMFFGMMTWLFWRKGDQLRRIISVLMCVVATCYAKDFITILLLDEKLHLQLLVSAKTFKPYLAFYFPRTADILNV